jgi:hypothetical protein
LEQKSPSGVNAGEGASNVFPIGTERDDDGEVAPVGGKPCGEGGGVAGGEERVGAAERDEDGIAHGVAWWRSGEEVGETGDGAGERGIGGLGAVVEVDAHADDGGVGAEAFDEDAGELGGADHDVVGPAEAVAGEPKEAKASQRARPATRGRSVQRSGAPSAGTTAESQRPPASETQRRS